MTGSPKDDARPTGTGSGPRPVCFVVMPFRVKEVPGDPKPGVPARIDFDSLWDRAIRPALESMEYEAVRGDADPSGLIIKEMMERLAYADLVLGDVTLPNGNAYYEVGIRHAALPTGCILMAAEWSMPLFDLNQVPAIRYPLPTEKVDDALAARIRAILVKEIPPAQRATTPYHSIVRDGSAAELRRTVFREYVDRLSAFQAGVREVRLEPVKERQKALLQGVLDRSAGPALRLAAVVGELVPLVRDVIGWQGVVTLVEQLPAETKSIPFVEEQRLLAVAMLGEPLRAVAGLESLIATHGGSPERFGLIGGRYKRLWKAAAKARAPGAAPTIDERRYLDKAITAYDDGFRLDLNAFYCSSNLPLLLLSRGGEGDRERATFVDRLVRVQCERAVAIGRSDEWVPFTLVGAALRLGDLIEVKRLVGRIVLEQTPAWMVDSSWADLEASLAFLPDAAAVAAATAALAPMAALRTPRPPGG